ncbi:MAG: hypothetical protein ACKVWV_03325 [Planctomycetota bacterium]
MRVLFLVALILASCRTHVHDWKQLSPPYAASQFDGRGEIWLRTDAHEWRMNAPRGASDERGEYVEGRVEHQPETIGPIEAVRVVVDGFVALATAGTSEPERVHLADVHELRVATGGRGQSSEWRGTAAVLFWLGLYAALAIAAF